MKNIVANLKGINVFGLLAIAFVAFATLAFTVEKNNVLTEKWAYDNGTWVNVDGQTQQPPAGGPGDYRCNSSEEPPICTAEFPEGVNPNVDPSGQSNEIYGNYIEL